MTARKAIDTPDQIEKQRMRKTGERLSRLGKLTMLATGVAFYLDKTIDRMDAFLYSAGVYTGTFLFLKLGEDFKMASYARNHKAALNFDVSHPTMGYSGKLPIAFALATAYMLAGDAAENEYKAQQAQREQAELRSLPLTPIDAPVKVGKDIRIAMDYCRGEDVKLIRVNGKPYKIACNGLDTAPVLAR